MALHPSPTYRNKHPRNVLFVAACDTTHHIQRRIVLTYPPTNSTSFYVSRAENGTEVICSNGSGATLSSTPYLTPIDDGKCQDGSGLSFSMHQVGEQAVELTVKDIAEGSLSGTWTSENKMVITMQSPGSNNPNGQITQYVGPADFELMMQQLTN